MGCGSSSEAPDAPPFNAGTIEVNLERNASVEKELKISRKREQGKVKLLFLGTGESGKSTIFKQLRIIHGAPRDDAELRHFGVVIRGNITTAMKKLCMHLRNLGLEGALDSESAALAAENGGRMTPRQAYDELIAHTIDNTAPAKEPDISPENDWVGQCPDAGISANKLAMEFLAHHVAIDTLWKSETMKEVWAKRMAINVIDTHKDFLNDIPRIASPSYRPTPHDILDSRVRTTKVIVEHYNIDGTEFEMFDVGGQRSERRKWIDCFDDVDAVIFVAALSEYDQMLSEAKYTNRMVESIELFRSICNNSAFAKSSILLFLNKKDIFAEKIMYSDIAAQRAFADYTGPPKDFDAGLRYFAQKFQDALMDDYLDESFIHVTCATDTSNMEFVLEATRIIIVTENLKRAGLLTA